GGGTLLALDAAGDLIAFDAATRKEGAKGDPRLEVQELARRARLGRAFATKVVGELTGARWENVAAAQYVLALAELATDDPIAALRAADRAIALPGRHPLAHALRARALVLQARLLGKELDVEAVKMALVALADRPELAADTLIEVAESLPADEKLLFARTL